MESQTKESDAPTSDGAGRTMDPRVATFATQDHSQYYGEVATLDGVKVAHGLGVLCSVFGGQFAGDFVAGKKHGLGVETNRNGATYAGEFAVDQPNGYGVYASPFGETYLGQWQDSARHGLGVCLDSDAAMIWGLFSDNERASEPSETQWSDVESHMQRALITQRQAQERQEIARKQQVQAVLEDIITIDNVTFQTPESLLEFEASEQRELDVFLHGQMQTMAAIAQEAGVYKFHEAELKQRQKVLRAEITARRQELSLLAKYCDMADDRKIEVQEAKRTFDMLHRQMEVLLVSREKQKEKIAPPSSRET